MVAVYDNFLGRRRIIDNLLLQISDIANALFRGFRQFKIAEP